MNTSKVDFEGDWEEIILLNDWVKANHKYVLNISVNVHMYMHIYACTHNIWFFSSVFYQLSKNTEI